MLRARKAQKASGISLLAPRSGRVRLLLPSNVDMFKEELRRVELRFELSKVKVVLTADIPELVIRFNEAKAIKIGPLKKDAEALMPAWLMRLFKESGHVLLHREERTDSTMEASREHKLGVIDPFFYQKSIEWLDTVEKLGTKGMVSHQMPKRVRSKFTTFLDARLKQMFDSISLPAGTLLKKLSKEEQVVAQHVQALLDAWERHILKREK